jgi:hypothetical protein
VSATVGLGLRLARAGGPLRAWSIAAGNAVGMVLLLGALAMPDAVYPDETARAAGRVLLQTAMSLLLVPAVVLLVTVGRLSSGVRDRQLAALRMLGMSRRQARRAAAVENGSLALAGALAGTALFVALARPVSRAMTPQWLAQPIRVSAPAVVATAVGLVALSVAAGTAATWDRAMPGAQRSESARRRPRAWRLAVLGAGLAALAWPATLDPVAPKDDLSTALFLGGTVATGVGIALVTPLVTWWLSGALTRLRGVAPLLAGRAIQTDSAGASRVVAGLGVAVFVSAGALGLLGQVERGSRYVAQVYGAGPQQVRVSTRDEAGPSAPTLADDDLASLSALPGVLGVVPDHGVRAPVVEGWSVPVFVGTCAQLALVVESSGCDDARAARIVPDSPQIPGTDPIPDGELADRVDVAVDASDPLDLLDGDDVVGTRTVDLAGPPVVEHLARQVDRWANPTSYAAFVPVSLVSDLVGQPSRAVVVAVGGTRVQDVLAAWADERGYRTSPYPRGAYDTLLAIRAGILTLCAVVVGVGLLILGLTAADRGPRRRGGRAPCRGRSRWACRRACCARASCCRPCCPPWCRRCSRSARASWCWRSTATRTAWRRWWTRARCGSSPPRSAPDRCSSRRAPCR